MGNIIANIFKTNEIKISMVGLDGAGKTTVLSRLKIGEMTTAIPIIGFPIQTLKYKNFDLTVWDIGGSDKFRSLWTHYFQNSQGLIFVIDSNDRDYIDEARDELQRLLAYDELRNVVLLIFANKQVCSF